MYQLDKNKFGAFVAALRHEKGMTQKQLAQQLMVSDKAVSKWERALSLPDIELLEPLACALGVTVTELLRGERAAPAQTFALQEVEQLLSDSLHLPRQDAQQEKAVRRRCLRRWLVIALGVAAELAACSALLRRAPLALLAAAPGGFYAWLSVLLGVGFAFTEDTLPAYYDENKVYYYSNRLFRINLAGTRLSNRNWPHIKRTGFCIFAVLALVSLPISAALLLLAPRAAESPVVQMAMTLGYLAVMFGPMVYTARRHQ